MFTIKLFRNFLLSGVNSSRVATSRSIQLFRKPKSEERKNDDDDDDEEEFKETEKFSFDDSEEVESRSKFITRMKKIRNKSNLRTPHLNMLLDRAPYKRAESWVHNTLKYKRMMYGRYGSNSNVDPRICFYTCKEMSDHFFYERAAHPMKLQDMIALNEQNKIKEANEIAQREADISAKLLKLEKWKSELNAKKYKKEEEARIAKERKDRLIEEVRRQLGFQIHPKDERFKELLEKKEKEQRKALKLAKRQEKEAKLINKIVAENKTPSSKENEQKEES